MVPSKSLLCDHHSVETVCLVKTITHDFQLVRWWFAEKSQSLTDTTVVSPQTISLCDTHWFQDTSKYSSVCPQSTGIPMLQQVSEIYTYLSAKQMTMSKKWKVPVEWVSPVHSETLCPGIADLIVAENETSQRWTPYQHFCKSPCSIIAYLIIDRDEK